ncbi:OmpA/MotB family protein [Mesonia phycicola]|nr:OmpA family protein [Mesonia phycicola]
MMKKAFIIPAVAFALTTACVPAKKYKELEDRLAVATEENSSLKNNLNDCEDVNNVHSEELAVLGEQLTELKNEYDKLASANTSTQAKYENLQNSYNALEKNSSSALAENSKQNRELLKELEEKQKALGREKEELERISKSLQQKSRRIDELEAMIEEKEAKMNSLKNSLSAALTNFEGKGLTVERRDGKVYVSMENKLLFDSGSWAVGSQGQQAVKQLGYVLAENKDIDILIEGHTDNVPYGGNGALSDNWDLSTKRATAIVHILEENKGISQERLTAAGRGEHNPIATNETAEGKAKNRRIEVILTPRLDEISRLLTEQ